MADCLVVTSLADEFAEETARLSNGKITVTACKTANEALDRYDGETVLFGNPQQISEILPQLPNVDWVQSSWAGITPLLNIERRDYTLTGVKDVFGPQMSEYVFGYLLAHELKILERKQQQEQGNWFGVESGVLEGKTLGILGTGSIGKHIATTARAFSMKSAGFNRSGTSVAEFDSIYKLQDLEHFLVESDHIVSTLPDTPGTQHLLNKDTIGLLSKSTYFVNVGRSSVVDDEALIDALTRGALGGAALDVFDNEPIPKDSPLWKTPNLSITAHIAAISHPLLIVPIFVENFAKYKAGQPLNHIVDFNAGY